ncbi:Hypothetical predicted protein [Mytilus galloprovincialis]|uniref:Uncharacterized protein n=1 Tax=Mytilus galloprovincialis TaxID=29158 RepID=A0A8B6E565_MYTGA|nr:Hypothetical predicted protein [Mytilus galloprovincialis]
MKSRFGSINRPEVLRAELQTRVRLRNETLPESAQAIKILTSKAYHGTFPLVRETLALDYSIDAIPETEVRLRKTGLMIARAVVQQSSNLIPLRMANFSETPVKIHKNIVGGIFEPVKIDTVTSCSKQQNSVNCVRVASDRELPEHLVEVFNKGSVG